MDANRVVLRRCLINEDHTIAIVVPTQAQIDAKTATQYVATAGGAIGEVAQLEIVSAGMGDIATVPWFDITNGDVQAARSIFVRPSIPQSYHWCPIDGLPREMAMANSDLFIRIALARFATHVPANLTPEQQRKAALILGMSRAVMTAYYGIEDNHLVPGERCAPMVRYQAATEGADALPAAFTLVANLPGPAITALSNDIGLTEAEKDVLSQIMMCAIGVPVLQGLSLVMVNHHYLSGNVEASRKAFDVVERQFWSTSSHRTWFTTDQDIVRDTMWHKAAHPILPKTKMDWAMTDSIRRMLITAGAGAAAARLPAEEPDVRAGNTCLTLCRTVEPLLVSYDGELNFAALERAITYVMVYRPGAGQPVRPVGMPANINSRETAVAHLANVLKANEGNLAMVFGFYSAQVNHDAMTTADEVPDTLVRANSLTRLQRNSPGAFRQGTILYKDYLAARNKAREAGNYVGARIHIADLVQ